MTANEYTLLIVESPTIADYIEQLHIPWLEVIATGGFCWYPQFDSNKLKLGKKADPEKRTLRRELKQKSGWFNRIVIAADTDSAGDFITWTISQFLANKTLHRTQLRLLTEHSVKNQVSSAVKISQRNLKKKLEKKFIFRHLWNLHFRITMEDAALASLFRMANPFFSFSDSSGTLFRSDEAVQTCYQQTLEDVKMDSGYFFHHPHSICSLLEELASIPSFKSFENSANKIFNLFTARLNRELLHTISYPRTDASGYYESTWKWIETEWIKSQDLGNLLPHTVRNILSASEPHEGLHPTNFHQTPETMKGLLKPDLFEIYTRIYERFMKSITWRHSDCLLFEQKKEIRLYPPGNSKIPGPPVITPVWTVESAGHRLFELGAARAANYGKKLDRWIGRDLIEQDGIYLKPKGIMKYDPELISRSFSILNKARDVIDEEKKGTKELNELFH